MNSKWTAAILVLLICGCRQQSLEPIDLPEHEVISCADYASDVTAMGVLYNNVWNKGAAVNANSRQCMVKRQMGDTTQYGWLWDWPIHPRTIFAQPQIKIGSSPWDPEPSFGKNLPIKISELASLDIAHQLDIISDGNFNVATTMWLTRGEVSKKESIAAELMIWTYYTKNQFNPGGKKIETFRLNSVEWELWEQRVWDDKSGVNKNKWRYLAFRLVEPRLKVEVDIMALIQHAISRQSIEDQWYIADLELGTEVMGGQGLAWIKQFDVRIAR